MLSESESEAGSDQTDDEAEDETLEVSQADVPVEVATPKQISLLFGEFVGETPVNATPLQASKNELEDIFDNLPSLEHHTPTSLSESEASFEFVKDKHVGNCELAEAKKGTEAKEEEESLEFFASLLDFVYESELVLESIEKPVSIVDLSEQDVSGASVGARPTAWIFMTPLDITCAN